MGALDWLWGRRKRRTKATVTPLPPPVAAVLPEKKPIEPAQLSAVLIDIPNVVNAWRTREHQHRLSEDWDTVLREIVDQETEHTSRVLSLAASSMEVWSSWGADFLVRNRSLWEGAGYTFKNDPEKDIDTIFAIDLMAAVAKAMEDNERVRLKLILVTGDGVHAQAVRRLRETYARRLNLDLVVYGWGNRVSKQYERLTNRNNIRFLETIPGITRKDP
jgi:hypothetical protein